MIVNNSFLENQEQPGNIFRNGTEKYIKSYHECILHHRYNYLLLLLFLRKSQLTV